jgi:hypothetical protein
LVEVLNLTQFQVHESLANYYWGVSLGFPVGIPLVLPTYRAATDRKTAPSGRSAYFSGLVLGIDWLGN